jgi:hypothetical protein
MAYRSRIGFQIFSRLPSAHADQLYHGIFSDREQRLQEIGAIGPYLWRGRSLGRLRPDVPLKKRA